MTLKEWFDEEDDDGCTCARRTLALQGAGSQGVGSGGAGGCVCRRSRPSRVLQLTHALLLSKPNVLSLPLSARLH
jgi:hypothetical protein